MVLRRTRQGGGLSLWHEPSGAYGRPSLIGDLIGIPSTAAHHQLENQATTVLAWLIDRCPVIGRAMVECFSGLEIDGPVGARTQVSLPKPAGGALRPDLSICAGEKAAQILVEVKVASDMAVYPEFGGRSQPDVYRHLWSEAPGEGADVRLVATLTRGGGTAAVDPAGLRGRDVAWSDVARTLRELQDAVAVEVRAVALSFADAIDERIAPRPPSPEEVAAFFAEHSALLDATTDEMRRVLGVVAAPKRIRGNQYFGWRVPLPDPSGEPLYARLYLAPAGTRLNLPGAPDVFVAAVERDTDGNLGSSESAPVQAAGFARTKDLDGYWLHRRLWPVAEADPAAVGTELAEALRMTGLLP